MQEISNYDQFQLNRYGNILPEPITLPSGEVIENGMEEMQRASQWVEMQAERDLHEQEYQHTKD